MTQVAFHVRVAKPLVYGCRLLRKALARYPRVTVTTPPAGGAALDSALWTFAARDFLPHAMASAPEIMRRASPIVIVEIDADHTRTLPVAPVLVNFAADPVAVAGVFERVIEVVADTAEDAASARRRWKAYVAAGMEVSHLDMSHWSASA